jgi:hypothetical protein
MTEAKKVVAPLDIDSLLGTVQNRVNKVGVELEGGWKTVPTEYVFGKDSSVFKELGGKVSGYNCGELPIGPFIPAALPAKMKKFYPDLVDHSCGMHMHMSFETLWYYQALMSEEYQETIIEYLTRWAKKEGFESSHHIWPRLNGESIYCQKKFWPDLQVNFKTKDHDQKRQGNRYTIVNFVNRPPKTPTIEIRVLPMMKTAEQGIRALDTVIDITNGCLYKLAKRREEKRTHKLELPNGDIYEEIIEEEVPLTAAQRKVLGQ